VIIKGRNLGVNANRLLLHKIGQFFITILLFTLTINGCSPQLIVPGPKTSTPIISNDELIMQDGAKLPLHQWTPKKNPKAVILVLHGFNDYGRFIKDAAEFFANQGYKVYAYDQRGFGGAPHFGRWPGRQALSDDLITVTKLLRQKHPEKPFFHLGSSMGGAVIMKAATLNTPLKTEGIILVAPAVRGRANMHIYERWIIGLLSHTTPWVKLTGSQLNIKPSDNIEMLRVLSRDPKVIKETRIDSIWGLINLMDDAVAAAPKLAQKTLILYGDMDEIINELPTKYMLNNLPRNKKKLQKIIRYKNGYHMLLRDLQAKKVWEDIIIWMQEN